MKSSRDEIVTNRNPEINNFLFKILINFFQYMNIMEVSDVWQYDEYYGSGVCLAR